MSKRVKQQDSEQEFKTPPKRSKMTPKSESVSSDIHPLLIDHILETVLNHLIPVPEKSSTPTSKSTEIQILHLLNLRQVCPLWSSIIVKFYKKKFPQHDLTFGFRATEKLTRFIETFRNESANLDLVSHYRFIFQLNFFIQDNQYLFLQFLEKFSPHISNMSLTFGENISADFNTFSPSVMNFKSLKKLEFYGVFITTNNMKRDAFRLGVGGRTIGIGSKNDDKLPLSGQDADVKVKFLTQQEQYDGLSVLLSKLLSTATSLSTFNFCMPVGFFPPHITNSLKFTTTISSTLVPPMRLSSLILISTEMSAESLELIAQNQNSLTSLHVNFSGCCQGFKQSKNSGTSGTDEENENAKLQLILHSLMRLLSNQEKLTSLEILDFESMRAEDFPFPQMSSLTHLDIKGSNKSTFGFLKLFPKLEVLKFNLAERKRRGRNVSIAVQENPDAAAAAAQTYTSVKEIKLLERTPAVELVELLAMKFPSLRHLELRISSAEELPSLSTVFRSLPKLQSLAVAFPSFFDNINLDPVLTGISPEACRNLLRERDDSIESEDSEFPPLPESVERVPNLVNLKELHSLQITSASYGVVVSDVTAHFSLLRMPSLKTLTMEQFNVSTFYFEKLSSRFNIIDPKKTPPSGNYITNLDQMRGLF